MQELDIELFARADSLVVDLASQCLDHGEICHAVPAKLIGETTLRELCAVLDEPDLVRRGKANLTVAGLTGIAAQDIVVANPVLETWLSPYSHRSRTIRQSGR